MYIYIHTYICNHIHICVVERLGSARLGSARLGSARSKASLFLFLPLHACMHMYVDISFDACLA